jgi:transposase
MGKQLYWLNDAEWKRIEPLLPRGRRGHVAWTIGV